MKQTDRQKYQRIGISKLHYNLPKKLLTLKDLSAAGKLHSDPKTLEKFGFRDSYIYENPLVDNMVQVARELLENSQVDPRSIDWIIVYSGLTADQKEKDELAVFSYPSWELKEKIGAKKAHLTTLAQDGCSGLLNAIDLARRILETSEAEKILCVTGDKLAGGKREIMYNVMSDACGAVVVDKNSAANRLIGVTTLQQSYYWDTPKRQDELLAAYFPMAQRAFEQCLSDNGLKAEDIAWVVPHNVSRRSWQILSDLIHVPMEKIWTDNIARIGHTVSCDHIINIADMQESGVLKKGDVLACLTFGFGASWSCMLLEH